jgi:uncharacterized membrane protein HdeD (DUF308 family)
VTPGGEQMTDIEESMEMQQSDDARDVLGRIGESWGWVLTFSVLTLILGVLVMAWPSATVKLVALLFGLQLFVGGLFSLVRAFTRGGEGSRVLLAVLGVLGILVGIFVLRHLFQTVVILVILLGVYWVLHGIIEFFVAIDQRGAPARGLNATMGILSFIAGVVVLSWPSPTLLVLVWVLGVWLVVYGLVGIAGAFMVRRAVKTAHA